MGLKIHRPKRGSMAYYPRKRAESLVAKFSVWPDPHGGKPILLGFAAYKAGMAHVVMIDDRPTSPFYSKEIIRPVTILDAPPIKVIAFRAYTYDPPWRNLKLSLVRSGCPTCQRTLPGEYQHSLRSLIRRK